MEPKPTQSVGVPQGVLWDAVLQNERSDGHLNQSNINMSFILFSTGNTASDNIPLLLPQSLSLLSMYTDTNRA